MKKSVRLILIVLVVVLICGLCGVGYKLYMDNEMNKVINYIEEIANKMYELENIESYKVKKTQTGLYEGRDYTDITIDSYDLKNKILKFDSKTTSYWCNDEDCKPFFEESEGYSCYDGMNEINYSYDVELGGWVKYVYDVSNSILVDYIEMTDVEVLRNIKSVKILSKSDEVEEYEVVVAKKDFAEVGFYSYEDIIKDATFKVTIKGDYIVKIETNTSEWYNDSTMSDYKDLKDIYEIYDINSSEVVIPEDIVNNAKES